MLIYVTVRAIFRQLTNKRAIALAKWLASFSYLSRVGGCCWSGYLQKRYEKPQKNRKYRFPPVIPAIPPANNFVPTLAKPKITFKLEISFKLSSPSSYQLPIAENRFPYTVPCG